MGYRKITAEQSDDSGYKKITAEESDKDKENERRAIFDPEKKYAFYDGVQEGLRFSATLGAVIIGVILLILIGMC